MKATNWRAARRRRASVTTGINEGLNRRRKDGVKGHSHYYSKLCISLNSHSSLQYK